MSYFIRVPIWSAGRKYGWGDNVAGLGLEKTSIDRLAKQGLKAKIRYYKDPYEYYVLASEIQKYPVEHIKNYETQVYIIPTTILKRRTQQELDKELCKIIY